jgi:hypothetical protein
MNAPRYFSSNRSRLGVIQSGPVDASVCGGNGWVDDPMGVGMMLVVLTMPARTET